MDNDDISQNVNHLNYAGVGLPGTTGLTASSSFRTNTHGSNVGGESPDGKHALSALHYQLKGMVPQYPAEYKSLNGYHFQNGSILSLERKSEAGDHFNPSSIMSSRQGQFNSLPPKTVNNNGPYFNGIHTKTTSNADGEADGLPPDGVPHNLEQMRLLHKFKELRRHQMQQQEMLMQQQEQQLALLRQEMKQRHRQVTNLQPPHIDISKEKQYQKLGMQTPPIKRSHRNPDEIISVQQIPNDSQQTVFYQLQEDDDLSSLEGDDPKDPSHLSPYPDLDGISRLEDDYLSESDAESAYVEGKELNRFNGQGALSPRRMGQSKGSGTKVKFSRSNRNASPDGDVTEKQQLTSSASENTHFSKSNPLDERPISSKLGRKKTFEELVEEQLKEEKENQSNSSTNVVVKRPFLRRGEGIARFHPPPDEKSIQRMKKGPRSVSSVPPAIVPPKEANRRPLSQPILSTKKTNKAVKLSVKPPKYPSSRQKLKLGGSLKPVPSVTPVPSEDPRKSVPLTSSSSLQSDQYATSFSSVSNAVPTSSKEVEKILRAIYDGEPVENGELSDPDSKKAERNSPTDSIEIEKTDLAEFEYMEQMADDMSFCSDTSVVIKFMDKRLPVQKSDSSESRMLSQIQRRDFINHFEESRPTSAKLSKSPSRQSQNSPKSDSIDPDDSLENSSDADTLIGSPEKVPDNELCMNERESVLEYEDSDVDDKAIQNQIDHLFENTSLAQRKSEQKDSVKISRKVTVASQFDFEAIKGSDVVFPPPCHQPKVLTRKIAQKENRSKQKIVPDVDSVGSSSSPDTFDHNRYEESPERTTNSDIHSSDECFTDDGTVENSTPNTSRSSSVIDEFDDYDEWNDTCDSVLKNSQHFITNGSSATEDNAAENLGKFITSDKKAVSSIASPPTSKLVSKLFPVLKSKPTNEDKSEEARQCKLQAVTQVPVGDGLQSKLLREKLSQLEKEIARFRKENANLEKLHREREEGVKKLRKDMSEFEAAKKEELEKLYEFKEEEMKKLRNERKVFEKYHKAVRSLPNKEQRQEIEMLKTQLSDFQEEMRRKESRWNSNTNRLRQRIQDLEDENKQLKEEVNFMENKRLEWLQEKESLLQTQKKLHQKNSRSQLKTSATPNSINSDQESDVGQKERKVHQMFLASPAGDYRFVGGGKKKEQIEPGKVVRTSSEAVPRQPSAMLATPQEMNNGNDDIQMELNRMPAEQRKKPPILKHSPIIKGDVTEEVQHSDGKIERRYQSGSREVVFSNGTRKEMSADGRDIILWFFNGDIKQITEDQTVVYFYAESQTTVTTYPGGLEVLEFPKGQIEKHYPDGTQEITFPDQTVKYLRPDGSEESHCQDGTIIKVDANRVRTLEFPNGQKEIHTEKFKRREYPDGTQKTIYPDGRQETKFSNGRIRIKDKDGNILLDKKF